MRDIENHIFTLVTDAVKTLCTNTSQVYNGANAVFPYVYFRQIDNPANQFDLDSKEVGSNPMIEIHVYTNGTGALSNNKKICKLIDTKMVSLGFQRTYGPSPINGLSESKITEQVLRYTRLICNGDIL